MPDVSILCRNWKKITAFDIKNHPDKLFIISEIRASSICGNPSELHWSEDYQAELIRLTVDYVQTHPEVNGVALWQYCNIKTYASTPGFLTRPHGKIPEKMQKLQNSFEISS